MDTREPLEVTVGDTTKWTRTLPDYPADDGWVLKYALRGPAVVDITASDDGSSHQVTITSAQLTSAGTYYVQGYVEKSGERHTVYTGRIKANPNLAAAAAGYDGRSHAQKVIEAIEAVIEGRASKDQQEFEVAGTRLVRMSFEELVSIRQRYRHELAGEVDREKRRQGRSSSRSVKFQL